MSAGGFKALAMSWRLFMTLGALALAGLAGCATTQGFSAAPDVHRLLIAIRDDDRQTFEALIDRRALEGDLQALVVERTRQARLGQGATTLGLLLSGPLSRAAGDLLIRPDVLRAAAEYYGYRPDTPIPGEFTIAAALSPLSDSEVCARLRRNGPCLLTFADEGGVWRLVGVNTALMMNLKSGGRIP